MNTKITAFVTAVIFSLTPLSALASNYYPTAEFPKVNASEFIAVPFDIKTYYTAEEAVRTAAKKSAFHLSLALLSLDEIISDAQTSYALCYIQASKNNTEENNALVATAASALTEISQRMSSLIMDLYNDSETRGSVTEWIGGEEAMREFILSYPTERFYELTNKENEILTKYRNTPFGSYIYTGADGNTYTFEELDTEIMKLLEILSSDTEDENIDYGAAYREYQKLSEYILDYIDKSGQQTGELFSELVRIRAEIARESGFNSYADYAHTMIYNRDYFSADISTLRETVKTHIVPLMLKLETVVSDLNEASITHEDIIPTVGKYIGNISPELKDSFDYMVNSGLVDMDYSSTKITPGNAYTIDIPKYKVPFVFISPVEGNTAWTLDTLVHEFGHFNANLYGSLVADDTELMYVSDIDISEIHSQGLELLFTDFYDEIYSGDSLIMNFNRLYTLLNSIIGGCLYDEWQEQVYEDPDMSVAQMESLYLSLCDSYGLEPLYSYEWTQVPHNFEEPMYYISYAVSAVAALDIWVQSLTDRPGAVDRYMRTTAYNDDKGFREALYELGYNDIFTESTICMIANAIANFSTVGYKDISTDDWFWQAVVQTVPFMDDCVENGNFRPHDSILRSEMANSIGMLHEYSGNEIAPGTTTFTDDDDSKYIAWAADNSIIKGYDSLTFGANDTLTREQAAVILYRYCGASGNSNPSSLNSFADYTSVSDWAYEAVLWAVDEGIVRGIKIDDFTSIINPQASITRAEAAQMMSRFVYYMDALNISEE